MPFKNTLGESLHLVLALLHQCFLREKGSAGFELILDKLFGQKDSKKISLPPIVDAILALPPLPRCSCCPTTPALRCAYLVFRRRRHCHRMPLPLT